MLSLLARDVIHHDLSGDAPVASRLALARFYTDVLSACDDRIRFVVEDVTDGDPTRVGVTWHLEVEGVEVPMTKGLSFYRVNPAEGRISYVRQSPEHFVRASGAAVPWLNVAAPVLRALGPAATPDYWASVSQAFVSEAVRNVISPLPDPISSAIQSFVDGATGGSGGSSVAAASFSSLPGWTPSGASPQRIQPGVFAFADDDGVALPAGAAPPAAAAPAISGIFGVPVAPAAAAHSSPSKHHAQTPSAASAPPSAAADAPPSPSKKPEITMRQLTLAPKAAAAEAPAAAEGAPSKQPAAAAAGSDAAKPAAAAAPAPQHQQPAPPQQQQPAAAAVDRPNLNGIWVKDVEASQIAEYEKALDLWQISGMQRATARLLDGLEISHQGDRFSVNFLTHIPYFKVTENYVVGKQTAVMRRDLRSGKASATAAAVPGGLVVRATWPAPVSGGLEESYLEVAPDVLHVSSTITIGGQSITTLQVYHRRNVSRGEYLKQAEQRSGSVRQILSPFGVPV